MELYAEQVAEAAALHSQACQNAPVTGLWFDEYGKQGSDGPGFVHPCVQKKHQPPLFPIRIWIRSGCHLFACDLFLKFCTIFVR